jgi:adenylate cyclase
MRAYEPLRVAPSETDAYAQAFARMEANNPTAVAAFAALVGARRDDPLAQYHLRRLLNGGSGVRLEVA